MSVARVLFSLLSVSGLGIAFGVGLAIAARLLAVTKDQRIARLEEALPGLNCGACGYAGCSSYAEAMGTDDDVSLTLCLPGGAKTAAGISALLGKEVAFDQVKKVTQVHCRGGRHTSKYKYQYAGLADCNALHALYGGDKVCPYGCLNLGSCIRVCPVDAIGYDGEGLTWVDKDLCISCGKCVDICPTKVMQWIPHDADYMVACNSTDRARDVRKYCSVGCTGCTLCVKKAPEGGFKVDDNLSRIDYAVTGDRLAAVEACPPKCIIRNEVG